jgi:hypothetical protein
VCGGFCEGGREHLSVCKGRCNTSANECRFDSDCPVGETCSESSPDCPGGRCTLSLVCGADDETGLTGRPCRIDYEHPVFGTPSSDCPPNPSRNISGEGLEIDYLPATSATLVLPSTVPCTAAGLELYECPCPDAGGQPTAPNTCTPACDAAGPNFGIGCADGTGSGSGTVCDGGGNNGLLCDDDADCPSATCSRNPTHCTGDPSFERVACTSNGDCGTGTCVDACPGGRCLPLCVATDFDATEGECAAGPAVYHCSGTNLTFLECTSEAASASCAATCASTSTPCTGDAECPPGVKCTGSCESARSCEAGLDGVLGNNDDLTGAGTCVAGTRECFLDPIVANGSATTLSAHDSVALFCFDATLFAGIDGASGFGGPGRVEVRGVNVPNFTAIPPP